MKRLLAFVALAATSATAWSDAKTMVVNEEIWFERQVGEVREIVPRKTYSFRPRFERFFISGVPTDRNNVGPVERCYIAFMLDPIVIPFEDYEGIMDLAEISGPARARLYAKYGIVPLSMQAGTVLSIQNIVAHAGVDSWTGVDVLFTFTDPSGKQIQGDGRCSGPTDVIGDNYADFFKAQFGKYLSINL